MKAILFLGTSLVGAQYTADAVKKLGYNSIFLLNIDEYSGDPRLAIGRCEHYKADVHSLFDILRAIDENHLVDKVIAVTSLLDETLHNACAVAKKLGIHGPDVTLSQLVNKATVINMIPEFSPPSLKVSLSNLSENQLNNFINQNISFHEFIIKPGISSGAVGIAILSQSFMIHDIKKIISKSTIENAVSQPWIIQPRIIGTLYSLEGYVKNGQLYFIGFSKRIRKGLTELASEFPVDDQIPQHLQQRCMHAITTLIQRSGYLNGYFHCEFIITPDSSYLIDANMGRIAGCAITQQIALAYGKNPVEIYTHIFDLGLFKGANTQDFKYKRATDKMTLNINYCLLEPAIVFDIAIPNDMVSYHTSVIANNKEATEAGINDCAWVGILAGFKENVLVEIKKIRIHTNKGVFRPFYALSETPNH